ncbi:MAG TPA: hypothetical protein VFD79_01580 [Tissierellaceae bacterium]|jgi:hypothetical protein|nr:hypothetical protein [Tissierellaceae bacterium]
MFKRTLASLMIMMAVLGFASFAHASTVTTGNAISTRTDYEIIKPEKEIYSSSERVVLINGRAPSGTEITVELYGTTDLTRRSFNLDRLPAHEDYILIKSDSVTSGNLGFFQKQMDLVRGINKLVIDFGVEGVEDKEFIVFKYDVRRTDIRLPYDRESGGIRMPLIR